MPLAPVEEALRHKPVAPLTLVLTLQLAVLLSVVKSPSVTITVLLVTVVTLCVPLFS